MTTVEQSTLPEGQRGFELLEMESGVKPQLLEGNRHMTGLVISGILTLVFLIMLIASIWSSIVVSSQRRATYAKDPTLRRRKGQAWFYFQIFAFPITTLLALVGSAYSLYALSGTTAVEPARAEELKTERARLDEIRKQIEEARRAQQKAAEEQAKAAREAAQQLEAKAAEVGDAIEGAAQNVAQGAQDIVAAAQA